LSFDTVESLALIRAGGVRAYATTSDRRITLAPDIPTFAELGLPAVTWSAWYGLFAPRETPTAIIAKLNGAGMETLADPMVRLRFADLGFEIFPREQQTPEALGALQKADADKWWPIIKELGIKAE
jgi:tripartite-type tricarboxylate transporter receptor subunit TctC